jgi:hypothetical protein
VSDYEALRRAQEVIAGADRGEYDEQFGISTEERELLTRAAGDKPLSSADVEALSAIQRHDLIAAAYDADRITHTPNGD